MELVTLQDITFSKPEVQQSNGKSSVNYSSAALFKPCKHPNFRTLQGDYYSAISLHLISVYLWKGDNRGVCNLLHGKLNGTDHDGEDQEVSISNSEYGSHAFSFPVNTDLTHLMQTQVNLLTKLRCKMSLAFLVLSLSALRISPI